VEDGAYGCGGEGMREAFACEWCGAMTSDREELVEWKLFPNVKIPSGKWWFDGGLVCSTCNGWLLVAQEAEDRAFEVGRWSEREKCARMGCC
jgi:hypothetical protein